jgi:hypothetical protein
MKREACGKPVKGLPKQEKSREAEGQRKSTLWYPKKAHNFWALKSPTLDEISEKPT